MTATRQTLATINQAATQTTTEHTPIPGERPATHALAVATVAAEAEPFQLLQAALVAYFDGDIDAALAEDETGALAEVDRIIAEHLREAQVRLAAPTPAVDWSDHTTLTALASAVARRAADLHFVQILAA